MLHHTIQDNSSSVPRSELPPWIIRLRMWDSIGTYSNAKSSSSANTINAINVINANANANNWHSPDQSNVTENKYYYSAHNPIYGKKTKVNIDNVWNPVDDYIYGPTQNNVFNQENKFTSAPAQVTPPMMPTRPVRGGSNYLETIKDPLSFLANMKLNKYHEKEHTTLPTASSSSLANRRDRERERERELERAKLMKGSQNRKLIVELYDNETPRLCDHNLLEENKKQMRPCSPLESYISLSKDMVSK